MGDNKIKGNLLSRGNQKYADEGRKYLENLNRCPSNSFLGIRPEEGSEGRFVKVTESRTRGTLGVLSHPPVKGGLLL